MANEDVKKAVYDNGLKLWELADALNINDGNLSRKLRKELPDAEKKVILQKIKRIAKEKQMK